MRVAQGFGLLGIGVLTLSIAGPAGSAPLRPAEVPGPLRPWVPWVLRGHEAEACPSVGGDDGSVCAWSGRLTLALDSKGGRFTQDWQVLARTFVPLPGDAQHWPLDVKANGKAVAVVVQGGAPAVELPIGRHALAGTFQWPALPESLAIPTETGIVAVTVGGRGIDLPSRTAEGQLFLQKVAPPAETDSLQIAVHRKLRDAVPLLLTTRLSLEVAGKAREVTLGKSLPAGFVPHALESPLPARIEADGRLRLQVRPGSWTLILTSRSAADGAGPPSRVTRPAPDGPWKEGEEVWVFEAAPDLRVVTVEGAPSVDPQQTTLPDDWRRLPAYVLAPGATLSLVERQRGDAQPAPDQLKLQRQLWLDFDGGGFTAQDRINGVFRRSWRLGMGPSEKLGRVTVGGVDQFITRLAGRAVEDGVEIRQGNADIVAASRIEGSPRSFPVAGWNHDFQSVAATLALPPGWRLLHATGADTVSATWLQDWTLLELFVVLVCALAAAKLFGTRAGVLTLAALGLSVTEVDAPQWLWLAVLVSEALARALGRGRLGTLAQLFQLGAWVTLLLVFVPFAVRQVRVGLFPAQENVVEGEKERLSHYAPTSELSQGSVGSDAEVHAFAEPRASAKLQAEGAAGILGAIEGSGGGAASLRGVSGIGRGARASDKAEKRSVPSRGSAQNLSSYDPSVIVQTGPGVPRWEWRVVNFSWNGPVERAQALSLWLQSPLLGAVLALLRVALLAGLAWLLLWRSRGIFRAFLRGAPTTAAIALLLIAVAPGAARAQSFPPPELLEQLRKELLEKPACGDSCATVGRLSLEAAPDQLRLRLEISAAATAAVPLPGHREHWVPSEVLVDGKSGPQLLGGDSGTLWLVLAAGSHQVVLAGPLPAREVVQLPLPRKPHLVVTSLRGWKVAGLGDDGEIADTLQLTREAQPARDTTATGGATALAATSLPPFVTVERTLRLGLKWQAQTRVVRVTPSGSAVLLNIPLLAGESPLGEKLRVAQGNVQVTMAPDETEVEWTSTLEQRPALTLTAARAPSYSEIWRLDLASLWHAEIGGIPPVHRETTTARIPEWRPWPGESVTLAITRPGGTEGQSLTVEQADLTLEPGARSTRAVLQMDLRSSRGGQHTVTLPGGATLEALSVSGNAQPLRQDGARVTFPLTPGLQGVSLTYRDPSGLGILYRTRAPELGGAATNVQVQVRLRADRWVLLVGGPRLGPTVLFWSQLLVALALGRTPLTPLRTHHWILLGLGLSQLPVLAAAIVAGYFVAMGLRQRHAELAGRWLFDLRQLGLVLWTAVAVTLLFITVREGLLATPDMQLAGNGSSRELLRWFSDRTGSTPPSAWVLSLPLLVYRVAMLAWALWMAVALIRWARWAWRCFSAGGLWRPLRRPKVPSA